MPGSATATGSPIAGAEVDIWHSSPEGFYENQDPVQADMNLRGKFFTDQDGHIGFRSVKPAGYPIPIDGPTGDLLRAQGRHNMRPAHLHFLATKDGFKTLISQLYVQDDKFLETDVQFGVTRHLIGDYVRHENEPAPAADVEGPWYSLAHTFVMEAGRNKLPRPPITGKAARRAAEDSASRLMGWESPEAKSLQIELRLCSKSLSLSPKRADFGTASGRLNPLRRRAPPRARPKQRSGRTGSHALPRCGCRPHSG